MEDVLIIPVSYTHLDVYKRQGEDYVMKGLNGEKSLNSPKPILGRNSSRRRRYRGNKNPIDSFPIQLQCTLTNYIYICDNKPAVILFNNY